MRTTKSRRKNRAIRQSSLRLESLERRELLTTAALHQGTLEIQGTAESDQIILRQANGHITVSGVPGSFAASQIKRIAINGGAGNDTIALLGGANDSLVPQGRIHVSGTQPITKPLVANGDAGNDMIIGGLGINLIDGGWGNDVIYGGLKNDVLYGGGGKDVLSGGAGSDTLYGGAGDDLLRGGDQADLAFGDDGNDHIVGGNGDDILNGGDGDDYVMGGNGADLLTGGDGDDIVAGGNGNDIMYGNAGRDTMYGNAGDDRIQGGEGSDHLYGYAGRDWIDGDSGNDHIYGGTGDDSLFGNWDNDTLYGEEGDDLLRGGDDDDYLSGGDGEDIIDGDYGYDDLYGDDGDDTMYDTQLFGPRGGGPGNDTYEFGHIGDSISSGDLAMILLLGYIGSHTPPSSTYVSVSQLTTAPAWLPIPSGTNATVNLDQVFSNIDSVLNATGFGIDSAAVQQKVAFQQSILTSAEHMRNPDAVWGAFASQQNASSAATGVFSQAYHDYTSNL
jgi:Ca2+-binding RTX toxin-like protein